MQDKTMLDDCATRGPAALGALACGDSLFVFDADAQPRVSSGGKRVYRGVYREPGRVPDRSVRAVAKFYAPDASEKFGREAAALGRGSIIGVGPKLLQVASAIPPDGGEPVPLMIEAYAGIPLSDALAQAPIPASGLDGVPEQVLCTQEGEVRERQLSKIVHDVALHVHRMHANGVCHGDLKASNVCVRSIGEHPWDIRATLIDFDLESPVGGRLPRERTAAYFDTLFERVPRALGAPEALRPSLVELDLACLEAVCLELRLGCRISEIEPRAIAEGIAAGIGVFRYTDSGSMRAWRIDPARHIAPFAQKAAILPLDEWIGDRSEAFAHRARALAQAELKGDAFLDAENIRAIESDPEMEAIVRDDDIAHAVFAAYRASLAAAGERPDYERFEQQPLDLQESCYGQAADLCQKLERLGYTIVRAAGSGAEGRVEHLDEEQVETMARWEHERWLAERERMGWAYGPARDAEKKTSPYLVPYDELDEEARETRNRAPMRESLAVLARAGLAAVAQEGREGP